MHRRGSPPEPHARAAWVQRGSRAAPAVGCAGIPPLLKLLAFLVMLPLAACGRSDQPGSAVQIDTLAGGAVHVRNPSLGIWQRDSTARWELVEEVRLGGIDGEGPELFGEVTEVLEDPLGRVWIGDAMATEIRVFAPDGDFVRTVGRKGSGPGELEYIAGMIRGPDGHIWTTDGDRWEVFDTAGVRVAGHAVNSSWAGQGVWTEDGRLLETNQRPISGVSPFQATRLVFAARRLGRGGELVAEDSLEGPRLRPREMVEFSFGGGMGAAPLPLAHNPSWVAGPHGDLWVSEGGGAYVIRRQRAEGDTMLIVEREYSSVPVSAASREQAISGLRFPGGSLPAAGWTDRIPDHHPPFQDFFPATDGSLWVRRTGAGDSLEFDVFGPDGRYLGVPRTQAEVGEMDIHLITGERMYAVVRDDLGVQSVLFLRIQRP